MKKDQSDLSTIIFEGFRSCFFSYVHVELVLFAHNKDIFGFSGLFVNAAKVQL